jgi:hypothetical protein
VEAVYEMVLPIIASKTGAVQATTTVLKQATASYEHFKIK